MNTLLRIIALLAFASTLPAIAQPASVAPAAPQSAAPAQPAADPLSPEANAKFLAEYAAKPGVVTLKDGLMYKVIDAGNGKGTSPISRQDIVTVEYLAWMIDGKVVDRTPPYQPRTFVTGVLIPGWTEALMKMKSGQQWQLVVPAKLAYGDEGRMPVIPPGQTLIFLVKLEKVEYP